MEASLTSSTVAETNLRYFDIGTIDNIPRLPIDGYQKKPLISLEKALEPVEHLLHDIQTKVKIAKARIQMPPSNNLTVDESSAIMLYTMEWLPDERCLYVVLNQTLRLEDRDVLKPWFLYLKLLLTALWKLPSNHCTVWRGIRDDLSDQYQQGKCFTWWSISSTTGYLNVLESDRFLGKTGIRTLFNIECKNGKMIKEYSYFSTENEILLTPATYFEVIGKIDSGNGLHIIHIRETEPPYQLINPPIDTVINPTVNPEHEPTVTTTQAGLCLVCFRIINKFCWPQNVITYLLILAFIGGMIAIGVTMFGTATQEQVNYISIINIHPNTKWKQNAIIIAGGNGYGDGLNQLSFPEGIYVDDDQEIYIADCDNHRIVAWKRDSKSGQIVAGGNGEGNRTDQLNGPTDVIVDKVNDFLIISDRWNGRVVRWSLRNCTSGETIISDVDCYGVTMDKNGYLYVSNWIKDEVRRWRIGESSGTIVAGGNGKGDHLNQLNSPYNIFVDEDYSVYVSDYSNHRVLKWMKGAKEGIIVAGGNGQGNSLTQLNHPQGVIVDQFGHVYVVDSWNNRVMRWCKGATEGNIVVGGKRAGEQSNQLYAPSGLSFDRQGNLYAVDWLNGRIQKFEIDSK